MRREERLLQRLDEIGKILEMKGGAFMLLGLGSVGKEIERLDAYSDLDFFIIAKPGHKMRFIDQLDWLEAAYPLAYSFKNCDIGYKVMFHDGIYGEFAIFEEQELAHAAYSEGRIVWKDPSYENVGIVKSAVSSSRIKVVSLDHVFNEALTNLYVGLGRYARGEKLSAVRFVEQYAIDSILSALHVSEQEVDYYPDPFGNDRRLEKRYPGFANRIGQMMQGYDKIPESALHILDFIEEIYPVNAKLSDEIRMLAKACRS
ncbi:hypothetical protein [Paenibacillus sp. SI8]|uniref:hypothetical protein n=1 Tax=unclassified Paenibacillus TaxID=185978 RepID=UPI003466B50C